MLFMCTLIQYLSVIGTFLYPSLLLRWMFEHDCLDTCCCWLSSMHVFCIFVFALVQRS